MRTYQGPKVIRPEAAEAPQATLVLGADLEVVVHGRHLAVEEEARIGRVGLHELEQLVHEVDETELEGAERRVPLAVPVRVGDDVDPAAGRAGRSPSGVAPASSVPGSHVVQATPRNPCRRGRCRSRRSRPAGRGAPCRRARPGGRWISGVPSSERGMWSSQISSCHGRKPSPYAKSGRLARDSDVAKPGRDRGRHEQVGAAGGVIAGERLPARRRARRAPRRAACGPPSPARG